MPFGPKNTPTFYTVTMKDLKIEYDILFALDIIVDLPNLR